MGRSGWPLAHTVVRAEDCPQTTERRGVASRHQAPRREGETVTSVGSLLDELLAGEHDAPEFEERERSLLVDDSRPFWTDGD
jgi:hypothetical protein